MWDGGGDMNRAEELIPAGSTPNSQNPIDAMHQRQSLLIFVDILVLTYLTYIFTGIWVLQAVLGLLVWSGYRNRRPWAYQGGIMVLLLASLLFALFAAPPAPPRFQTAAPPAQIPGSRPLLIADHGKA